MTKAERAITALRDCADALEACPIRMTALLSGYVNSPERLRNEADFIEHQIETLKEALSE